MPTPLQQRGLLLVTFGLLLAGAVILVADQVAVGPDLGGIGSCPSQVPTLSLDAVVLAPVFRDGEALINLNQATEQELIRLPGIGEVLAARIVADRNEHGPFHTVDELDRVSGIGPVLIDSIRDDVTVEEPSGAPSVSEPVGES